MFSNRITELFGIRYPIIQAGMVWVSGYRLAAAVAEVGGLGLIGAGSMKPDLLSEHILKFHKASSKPFGVNIPLIRGDANDLISVVLEHKVPIVFTSSGSPAMYTEQLRSRGIIVVHVIANVRHAQKAEVAGCNAIVAEGFEAGGHNGIDELTTFTLIPQICTTVSIPVIAAGGVATGRQMAAAFALGAEGVQVGTRFAATIESSAHDEYKHAVVAAADNDTIVTFRNLMPVRMLKTPFALKVADAERSGATKESLTELLGTKRERMGIFEGNMNEGMLEAGQSAGLVKAVLSARDVVNMMLHEYNETVRGIEPIQ